MSLFASRRMLAALIGANALLVCSLVLVSSTRQAQAAGFGGGNYSLVVGQSNGLIQETVYVADTRSGKMWSVICNPTTRKLELYGAADLGKDLNDKGARPR